MVAVPDLCVLYGGTFDPVHAGHMAVAEAAADLPHAVVVLVPSADPPLRAPPGASAEQRAAMLGLAVEHHPRLRVDRRELKRPGPSYSVDTLREVRAEIGPAAPLAWLLGADAFRQLHRWHQWEEMFALAHMIVAARPGYAVDELDPGLDASIAVRWTDDPADLLRIPFGLVMMLDLPLRSEAASTLREHVAKGRPWDDESLPAVAGYIRKYGLYRERGH